VRNEPACCTAGVRKWSFCCKRGENTLVESGMIGMAQGGVSVQRANRGRPSVAGARAIFSLVLQVVEEGADQRGIVVDRTGS
jgi:hypothetical protein